MEWTLVYKDKNGIEKTSILNDGEILSTLLRGITFKGIDFDSLEPEKYINSSLLESFSFSHGNLCNCIIEVYIQIPVCENDIIIDSQLKVVLELGNQVENGFLDKIKLILTLFYKDNIITSSGLSGWFEDELLDIQKKLHLGTYIRACINCAYSDYSPYGHGLFGTMMCFRNLKQEYLLVKSKDEFWEVHDRYDRLVQETYCCEEFELRITGTGYRG